MRTDTHAADLRLRTTELLCPTTDPACLLRAEEIVKAPPAIDHAAPTANPGVALGTAARLTVASRTSPARAMTDARAIAPTATASPETPPVRPLSKRSIRHCPRSVRSGSTTGS